MDYDDFDIQLVAGQRGYELDVRCAEGEDTVPVPWGPEAQSLAGSYGRFRGMALESATVDVRALETLGRELSALLFPQALAVLWQRSRVRAADDGRGLRSLIHIDLRRKDLAWFGTLPWELLYDDDSGGFLALDARTPVVRYLDIRRSVRTFPVARPLRVLVIMPEPYGTARLDVVRERDHLLDTWSEDGRVELVFPESPTFDDVRHVVSPGPIHAIHFMGHGAFDPKSGDGGIVLEGPTGNRSPRLGRRVGELVAGVEPPPAFSVLNGCETGRTGPGGSIWPFGSAATALMEAGMSASVAMQLAIDDDEAIRFSGVLYRALQAGHTIEGAVAEARLSLREAFRPPVWAIPALFMRVRDGRLFSGIQPGTEAAEVTGRDRVRVEVDDYEINGGISNIIGRDEDGNSASGRHKTTVIVKGVRVKEGIQNIVGKRQRKV